MKNIFNVPLEQSLASIWASIDSGYKKAFLFVFGLNLLAFGFEMTNLTLHHDDVSHIFIQDGILGHYLGRFGFGWLHYHSQNAYIMPFLQMIEGTLFMSAYGLLISYFWGVRNTLDIVLVSSVLCVFPYMAQIYQYNTSIFPFAFAHFLAAVAVVVSTRFSFTSFLVSSLLYLAAFSIYQSVLANAATIFSVWVLGKVLVSEKADASLAREIVKSAASALLSVVVAGLVYLAIVSTMNLQFDSYQAAGKAFDLGDDHNLKEAFVSVFNGTRSFFRWPENYFPGYLKNLQLLLLFGAGLLCFWLPKGYAAKVAAAALLVLTVMAPRILQLLHPEGTYHNLTLTAYAVVISGAAMIVTRTGNVLARNLGSILTIFILAGYIMQCNWISTVNHLNTMAHYSTLTQLLSRIRAIPGDEWDGRNIAVVGNYNMSSEYPFKSGTGIAVSYMDAIHMQHLAKLMREDVTIIQAEDSSPDLLKYAENKPAWPHPDSLQVVDGVGIVVLSDTQSPAR